MSALLTLLLLTNPDSGVPVEPMIYKGPKPELYAMPLAASRYGLPDGYTQACALFDEASKDYAAEKPEKAAPKFIQVAELLKAPKQTTYSAQFAKMRAVSYQDAAIAFEQAGKKADGKKAIGAAAASDAENADLLAKLAAKLN